MECGLQWKEITCWEVAGRAAVTHEETMETAIAEYCPDIGRIVETAGQVQIRSCTADGKTVTVSGAVQLTVLYTSEESAGLRALTVRVPFTCASAEPRLAAAQVVWATGRLLLCEAQALTPRRLYLRVIPELCIVGYRASALRLCAGAAEEESLRMRRMERTVCLTVSVAERTCSVAQETAVPSDRSTPEELLCSRLYPRVMDCQPVGNKLMVRGELHLSALCRYRDTLDTYDAALPFSQVVELPDGAGEGDCTAEVQLALGEVRLLRGEESGGFAVTAELRLLLTTRRSETLCCVADLYSVRCDTRVEARELTFPAVPERDTRQECVQHLDFGHQRPFVYLTNTDCAPTPTFEGDELRVTVRQRLLYLDEGETPAVTERTAELPLPETARDAVCTLCGAPEVSFSPGGCDIRQGVALRAPEDRTLTLTTVTSAEILTERQAARHPSLVLRRPAAGETLWDVAKQYHSDETLIRAVNGLEAGELPEKMLLIPRIR